MRLWPVGLLFGLVAGAWGAMVSVTVEPPGAQVRWSRADSPRMTAAGQAPLSVDVPTDAGVVLEVSASGYLPRFVPVAAGQASVAVSLRRYELALLPELTDNRGVRPGGRPALFGDAHFQLLPTADGAGWYGRVGEPVTVEGVSWTAPRLVWRDASGASHTLSTGLQPGESDDGGACFASSPDGRWAAWLADRHDGGLRLALCRRDGGPARQLAAEGMEGMLPQGVLWSPDGAAVWAYDSARACSVDLATGRLGPTLALAVATLAISPDGRFMAYWTDRGLALRDNTSGSTKLLWSADGRRGGSLAWSPDGQTVAGLHGGELVMVPRAGGSARMLFRAGEELTWLPDGQGVLLDQRAIGRDGSVLLDLKPPVECALRAVWRPDSRALLLLGDGDVPQAMQLSLDGRLRPLPGPGFGSIVDGLPLADGWLLAVTDEPRLRYQAAPHTVRLGLDGHVEPSDAALPPPPADGPWRLNRETLGGTANWVPAVPSPDGRWLVAVQEGSVLLAEASAPDQPRVLTDPKQPTHGPWIHAARPAEVQP